MKIRKAQIGALLIAALAAAGWYGWYWYTTPAPPDISLDGVYQAMAEKIEPVLNEVRRQPRSGKAWGELGMALMANASYDHAMACLAQARQLDPQEPRWHYLHGTMVILANPREGFPILRSALAVASVPEQRADILFALALGLVEDGQLDEAETHISALRAIESDSARLQFVAGLLAFNRDDRAQARERLVKLIDHPCARKRVCSLLAGLLQGDEKLAQECRQKAVQLPEDQRWPTSLTDQVQQYRPDPEQQLGIYHDLLAQNRNAEALDYLSKLAAESPSELVCFGLGFNLLKLNEFEEAEKAFGKTVGFNPRNVKAHLLRGVAMFQLAERRYEESKGKTLPSDLFQKAVQYEDKALELQSDLADAHLTRGRALMRLGRTKDAIAALREAAIVGAAHAEMHQALGEALAEAGQWREGLEHLENAVRLAAPENQGPSQALKKWRAKAKEMP